MNLPDVTELAEIVFADAVSIVDESAKIDDKVEWVFEEYQKELSAPESYWKQVRHAVSIAIGKYALPYDLKHPDNKPLEWLRGSVYRVSAGKLGEEKETP